MVNRSAVLSTLNLQDACRACANCLSYETTNYVYLQRPPICLPNPRRIVLPLQATTLHLRVYSTLLSRLWLSGDRLSRRSLTFAMCPHRSYPAQGAATTEAVPTRFTSLAVGVVCRTCGWGGGVGSRPAMVSSGAVCRPWRSRPTERGLSPAAEDAGM